MTNLGAYLAIAKEAFARSAASSASGRWPKPNGEPGHVISYDSSQSSFKDALTAIVFAGVYFDALLYLEGCKRLGVDGYMKIERRRYEVKLQALGISDMCLLAACEGFRVARNEIVHEKALEPTPWRTAQDEAKNALVFIDSIVAALGDPRQEQ